MHELSIAYRLVETAEAAARKAGAAEVESVQLRLGALSGVVKDALLFSFPIAAEGTLLAGAQLVIDEVPVAIFCARCRAEAELPGTQQFRCPHCNTPSAQLVRGRELELVALEIREADGATTT
jgi:hydrogenase nickel incorporation protein HypA/HybF